MSVLTIADLRARSERTTGSACWQWLGATVRDGSPRIWTLDYDRLEKRSMNGAKAVFFISQGCALNGRLAYRGCLNMGCVNPDHIRTATDRAEIGGIVKDAGKRKGTNTEQRLAALAKAQIAAGHAPTSRDIVLAIRSAPRSITGLELARVHGLAQSTVSRIRLVQSHREVRDA